MAEPRTTPPRGTRESSLPVLDRFAPAPPEDQVRRWIGARSSGSDIVVELHGRGGWITRAAAEDLRRGYDLESTALTRLVAELVLRPPDLRHLDAAFTAFADQQRGGMTLRESIDRAFASRCGHCGGPVVVEEFVWDGDAEAPSRRSYRCGHCRETRAGDTRTVPVDAEDIITARRMDPWPSRDRVIERFPVPHPEHELPDQLLDLYTARQLDAIVGVLDRIEGDLRAPGIEAALRLLLVGMLLPASKLNSFPGRVAQPRLVGGKLRPVGDRQWRERNPWLILEDGFRTIRGFVQRLEVSRYGTFRARFGPDLKALREAAANVVVRQGSLLPPEDQLAQSEGGRVRLVLTQPPVHWSPENLAFAYLATSLALGLDAALTLPLDAVFDSGGRQDGRSEWARDASELYRSLAALRPQLGPDGTGVLLLDRQPAGAMVASVVGAVAAGYRLRDVTFRESGQDITGAIELTLPGGPPPVERDLPKPSFGNLVTIPGAPVEEPTPDEVLRRAITSHAVSILQARGEPARYERLLGEVLLGLDRSGHLQRVTADWAAEERRAAGLGPDAMGEVTPDLERTVVFEPDASTRGIGADEGYEATRDPGTSGNAPVDDDTGTHSRPVTRSWRDPERPVRGWAGPPVLSPNAEPATTGYWIPRELLAEPEALPSQDAWAAPPVFDPEAAPGGEQGTSTAATADDPESPVDPTATLADDATSAPATLEADEVAPDDATDGPAQRTGEASPSVVPTVAADRHHVADPIKTVLDAVTTELHRNDHPHLVEVEPGRWWLRDPRDMAGARAPLSDRVEWAVYSLLSTSGGIAADKFNDRITSMFRGHDTPDDELIRACVESYRVTVPDSDGLLQAQGTIQDRFREHGELVAGLAELGHRLGLRVWISPHEQRRMYDGRPAGVLLSDAERRAYLPLVTPGPVEALEQVDAMWYLRGKATFIFEVEWTAMLGDPVLKRGTAIPSGDTVVRFLVVPAARTELIRLKLARAPVIRERLELDNWHILKAEHLRTLMAAESPTLDDLGPLLGLDPAVESLGGQLPLFGTPPEER